MRKTLAILVSTLALCTTALAQSTADPSGQSNMPASPDPTVKNSLSGAASQSAATADQKTAKSVHAKKKAKQRAADASGGPSSTNAPNGPTSSNRNNGMNGS